MIVDRIDIFDFKIHLNEHELNYMIDLVEGNWQTIELMLVHAINRGLSNIEAEQEEEN